MVSLKPGDVEITKLLKAGAIGVIPTDTLYGLVASAHNEQAAGRLYGLKGRSQKPGTLIAATIDQLVELGLKKRYLTAVEHYWPGPISIVIPTGSALPHLHQGKYSLAVRIPKAEGLLTLLRQTGPLITSSANHPGEEPAKNVAEAQKYFADKVDFYVDSGFLSSEPSTIIRIVDDAVEVLCKGAITINEETGRIAE